MAKEINAGYEIIKRKHLKEIDIVLGYNPKAPEQYVTWRCKNNLYYYHGHYFTDESRALKDFNKRIREEKQYAR